MEQIAIGGFYTFDVLENYLINADYPTLIVLNKEINERAVMHVFSENFSPNYKSGDGVLFYANGEAHSANSQDIFKLISVIGL